MDKVHLEVDIQGRVQWMRGWPRHPAVDTQQAYHGELEEWSLPMGTQFPFCASEGTELLALVNHIPGNENNEACPFDLKETTGIAGREQQNR